MDEGAVSKRKGGPGIALRAWVGLLVMVPVPLLADTPTPPVTLLVPVVLDVRGVPPTHYTSDLVVVNRSGAPVRASLRYLPAPGTPGAGGPDLVQTLGAGREFRTPDVLDTLRQNGWEIPTGAMAVGSLTVTFEGVSDPSLVFAGSRASTPNPNAAIGGSYGVFAAGTSLASLPAEPLTLLGLREDDAFRSNLAIVDVPSGTGGAAVSVQLFDGDTGSAAGEPVVVSLEKGDWKQIDSVLALRGVRNGWARVTRAGGGSDPFFAYAVVNDGAASGGGTSDGSLVLPGATDGLVPIVLRVPSGDTVFSSELILANTSSSDATASLVYTMAPQLSAGLTIETTVPVGAGRQVRIPDVVLFLWSTLPFRPPIPAAQGGTLAVSGGVAAMVRTSNPNPDPVVGGSFGVSYPAFARPARASGEAWVFGLRQDETARSNLAIADARVGDPSAVSYLIDLFDSGAGSGAPALILGPITLTGGEWRQLSGVLGLAGLAHGYARVRPQAGTSDFVAYGVVNDGAWPGQGTSDGSFLPPTSAPQ